MGTIDADAHVVETERTWEFAEGSDRQYMPQTIQVRQPDGTMEDHWLVDGRHHPRRRNIGLDTTEATREMADIEARLAHMDALGVDMHVLYPSIFLRPLTRKPEVELALHRSYNRWLADICEKGKGRLRWAAMAPVMSMDKAIEEIRWARQHGACAVFMRSAEADKRLTDHYFDPLYEEAIRLDMPIGIHSAASTIDIYDFFATEQGFNKFKLAVVGTFHSIVMEGLPKRFPDLRIAFIEVSSQWVPYVVHDIRKRRQIRGGSADDDLLRSNNLWVACQTDDDLPYVLKYAGEDNLVIGSDYGHNDTSTELAALGNLRESGQLAAHVVDKILDANPRKLYAL